MAGTARTRGMRGAATAATAAMRLNYGRSTTPDLIAHAVPEARASSRRVTGGFDAAEDAVESNSLIVRLRINPARYKQWMSKRRFGRAAAPPLSGFPTSVFMAPHASATQPPTKQNPSTPALQNKTLPVSQRNSEPPVQSQAPSSKGPPVSESSQVPRDVEYDPQGRVVALHSPSPNETPVSSSMKPPLMTAS